MQLGLGLGLGNKPGGGGASPIPLSGIVLSRNEIGDDAAAGTVVGTLLSAGGRAPYTYTLVSSETLFQIVGDELRVAATLTGPATEPVTIRSTDARGNSFQDDFTITILDMPIDNDSGIGDGDGDIVDDGGFEVPPVEQDTSGGLKLTGKSGGTAKFIFDIGAPTAGATYTMRYDPDWTHLSQQGRRAFVGFGFKTGNDFHFSGLKGDGTAAAVLHAYKISGAGKFNASSGFTTVDGGAAANGTRDGPNWLQIEISADGETYTLRSSADGATWVDEFTDSVPVPLAAADDAAQFGIAVFLENADKGVFSVAVTLWTAAQAFQRKIGTFTSQAGTGNQAITGIGFRPAAVIIFRSVTPIGVAVHAHMSIGAGSGPSNQFVAGYRAEDNVTTSDTRRFFFSDAIIFATNTAADTTFIKASLVSLDADGFTLNWSTAAAGNDYIYIAISDDIFIHVGKFDLNSGTGNQSITGTGFQPKGLLFFNARGDSTEGVGATGSLAMGAASSASARWAHSGIDTDNLPDTDCARNGASDKCLQRTSTSAVLAAADLVSMDGNGFTINVTTGQATRWGYVAIGGAGVRARAGVFDSRTTNGAQAYTGIGFQPRLLIFAGEGGSLAAFHVAAFGAAISATERGYISSNSQDNLTVSNAGRSQSISNCVGFVAGAGNGPVVEANLVSMDADGFTLNWGTTDGVARRFSYLALA